VDVVGLHIDTCDQCRQTTCACGPPEKNELVTPVMPRITRKTRVVSLKRPWGKALVEGYKDVENRHRPLSDKGWLLVLSSKAAPKKSDLVKLYRSLVADGKKEDYLNRFGYGDKAWGEPQCILGWIHVSAFVNNSTSSWAVPGCCHWVIDKAIAFDVPLRGPSGTPIKGCQSTIRFVGSMTESVIDHLISNQPV
jgi:hypothetical protein